VPLLQQPLIGGWCCFKASKLFGLLQTSLCWCHSWYLDQDLKDEAIFWPISYLFVFSALYFCFGFVVREPNPFLVV
jgi:hypothetical protein